MKSHRKQINSSTLTATLRKNKVKLAIAIIIILLVGWWAWSSYSPKPLGDRLEYIGKDDYGCWIGFCDSRPGTTYFYATDMTPKEVAGYFKQSTQADDSTLIPPAETGQKEGSYDIMFSLTPINDPTETFHISFFADGQTRMRDFGFKVMTKKHVVEIDAKDYWTAQSAL